MGIVQGLLRAKDIFQGAAWDCALNLQEMWTLGGRGWWLPLHWQASRAYFSDPPAHVMLREADLLPLPEGQYVYGETPALSMLAMLQRVRIEEGDVLADLGCGRGLAAMAAALDLGIPVLGFEALPTLVARARSISSHLRFRHPPRWIQADFLEASWHGASVFYVASTTFHADVMRALHRRLTEHETVDGRPLRVITLSEPLGAPFRLVARQRFPMTWGWNTVFFHIRENSARPGLPTPPQSEPEERSTMPATPPEEPSALPATPPDEPHFLRTAGAPMPPPPRHPGVPPPELPRIPLAGMPVPPSSMPPTSLTGQSVAELAQDSSCPPTVPPASPEREG